MAVFADSSVWIDYFGGTDTPEAGRLDTALAKGSVVTGDLILTEVLQGYRTEKDYRSAKRALLSLPLEPLLGVSAAIEAADAYRTLRAQGITVRKTIDVIIACHCVRRGHVLLHADRDFDLMAEPLGLRVG